jgi:hypothetical protein
VVSVTDSGGKRVEQVITVVVQGEVQQHSQVRLVAESSLTGSGVQLSDDGLSAHWTRNAKQGVRANQGLYGAFWYVEGHRLIREDNQAIGLVIGGVTLDPYPFNVTPPSCSVNTTGPDLYHDLMFMKAFASLGSVEYYGLAVDYRGHSPIVYVILAGRLVATLPLADVTVPVYPMLYGNRNDSGAGFDMAINFGSSPFHEDPKAALEAEGIDASALRLCWGAQNADCQ